MKFPYQKFGFYSFVKYYPTPYDFKCFLAYSSINLACDKNIFGRYF